MSMQISSLHELTRRITSLTGIKVDLKTVIDRDAIDIVANWGNYYLIRQVDLGPLYSLSRTTPQYAFTYAVFNCVNELFDYVYNDHGQGD